MTNSSVAIAQLRQEVEACEKRWERASKALDDAETEWKKAAEGLPEPEVDKVVPANLNALIDEERAASAALDAAEEDLSEAESEAFLSEENGDSPEEDLAECKEHFDLAWKMLFEAERHGDNIAAFVAFEKLVHTLRLPEDEQEQVEADFIKGATADEDVLKISTPECSFGSFGSSGVSFRFDESDKLWENNGYTIEDF